MKVSQTVENLVYLFLLEYPEVDAETMHKIWEKNVILKEYKRPSIGHLKLLILMIKDGLEGTTDS